MDTIYINGGEPVETLPLWALGKMTEHLVRVAEQYFAQHPDEGERLLQERAEKTEKVAQENAARR